MCGAFSIYNDISLLSKRFGVKPPKKKLEPRYNVRPSQSIPLIFNTEPDQIDYALWGIHPFYDKTGKMFLINARNDSLSKTTWKKSLQERRCLILADGFYEWKKTENGKIPYRFEMKNKQPFAFAGLWQEEKDKSGKEAPHSVIITTEPNKLVADVHNRMPAILTPENEKEWLNPDIGVDEALKLLRPYPEKEMIAYPVSILVNSPKNDIVQIIESTENIK
jgi:putative SOS response-associated peptidase YedK